MFITGREMAFMVFVYFLNELFQKIHFVSAHKRIKINKKEFSECLEKEYLSNFNRN